MLEPKELLSQVVALSPRRLEEPDWKPKTGKELVESFNSYHGDLIPQAHELLREHVEEGRFIPRACHSEAEFMQALFAAAAAAGLPRDQVNAVLREAQPWMDVELAFRNDFWSPRTLLELIDENHFCAKPTTLDSLRAKRDSGWQNIEEYPVRVRFTDTFDAKYIHQRLAHLLKDLHLVGQGK